MPARNPYKRLQTASTPQAQNTSGRDPMAIDARQAANQRGPYDYLKPRARYDGVVQSANFPQAATRDRTANPLVVGSMDTTVVPEALEPLPRGLLRNAWPAFKDITPEEIEKRAHGLIDVLERDGLHFQAMTVGEHEGRPMFMLYLDRALRANEMVPTEHDGIRVQRMTVGKFKA